MCRPVCRPLEVPPLLPSSKLVLAARRGRMLALRARRVFAPLSRNALPRLSCARQLCTPAAKPEEPADDGQPKLLYEGGNNKVLCVRTPDAWPRTRFCPLTIGAGAGGDDA